MVSVSKPIAIAFVTKCEKRVTKRDKTKIKAKNCKKMIDENRIFCFVCAYAGIKAWVNAPSAKILLNKLGILKAIKKISEKILAPKIEAIKTSLKKPNILETKIPLLLVKIDLINTDITLFINYYLCFGSVKS